MDTQDIRRVAVLGPGMMGPGIALCFALGGRRVILYGRRPEGLERGVARFEASLATLLGGGVITAEEAASARGMLETSTDLPAAVAEADLVVESISEKLAEKRAMFNRLETLCQENTILTSNTSGLRITEITAEMVHPERAATTHFWYPPQLIPLVEVVKGERTAESTVLLLRELLVDCGKQPVIVWKDTPGQLGNRILHAIKREAMAIIQEGVATAEEVDLAVKTGLGLRMPVYGPMEHADLVGLELEHAVQSYLLKSLCNSTEPMAILEEKIATGELGVKTGKGFYDWSKRSVQEFEETRDAYLLARLKDMYPPRRRK